MGQKSSSSNSVKINSSSSKQIFQDIKSSIKSLRKGLLGIYQIKTKDFISIGDDITSFIDILRLLKSQQSETQYKNYLVKISQYIEVTFNARDQLLNILQSNTITNEKTILKIQIYLLKLQNLNQMKYSSEFLFMLGRELEDINQETLSTWFSV